MFKVEEAVEELRNKSMLDIERETAIKWGGRACASFELAVEAGKLGQRVRHLYEGENYRQEALEHASMTEDLAFIQQVVENIEAYRKAALENIEDILTKTDAELGFDAEQGSEPSSRRTMRPGGKHVKVDPAALKTGSTGVPAGVRGETGETGVGSPGTRKPSSVRGGRRRYVA